MFNRLDTILTERRTDRQTDKLS